MTEHASGIEQPSFHELLDETKTRANGILSFSSTQAFQALLTGNVVKDVPEAVKLQILSSIRSFVEKQIE